MKRIFYLITFLLLATAIPNGVGAQGYGTSLAQVSNVYNYHVMGATNQIAIVYTLSGCNNRRDFYYVDLEIDPLMEGITVSPSEGAVVGTSLAYPVRCGTHEIIWDFSKEPAAKQAFLDGDFIVTVHTVDAAYGKYARKVSRLEKRRLRALAKGKHRKAARIAVRQEGKRAKYGVRL